MLSILLLCWPGPAIPSTPHTAPAEEWSSPACDASERIAFRKLRSLTVKARRGDRSLKESQLAALPALLRLTHALRLSEPSFEAEINLALFEMAALAWVPVQGKNAAAMQVCADLGRSARHELERYAAERGDELYTWIAQSILSTDQGPVGPRIVAAKLLQGIRAPSTRQALMFTARTSTLELRDAALEALVGWDDRVVSHFFLEFLAENGRGIQYLARHFTSFNGELDQRVEGPLTELCRSLYRSNAWRDGARAQHLIRCLSAEMAIPILLDALVVWDHRMGTKNGSRRVLLEISTELRRITGVSMGPKPEAWQKWWQGVESGRFSLLKGASEGQSEVSVSGFYGLQPLTDRVLFIIDRSGSMDTVIGTDGSSRYEEAVEQFVDYMHTSGPETQFSVVLFSDDVRVHSQVLKKASTRNLESAERWLRQNGPDGGTWLHKGIKTALKLGQDGRILLDKVQADTVIVLCDGDTEEGPGWVAPWLQRWNGEAQILFRCVEIGRLGNGTLRALAQNSGGSYIQVLR